MGPSLYLKLGELVKRSAASCNIDTNGLVPTDEEIAAAEQQAQMQALIQHLGPNAITQLGGMGNTAMKGLWHPHKSRPAALKHLTQG
jgi:hypothetical protein